MASGKMNSLARSNASLYGNKEELYDRLRRHAYQGGKKGRWELLMKHKFTFVLQKKVTMRQPVTQTMADSEK